MIPTTDPFSDALGPESGTPYRLSRAMARFFPGKAVVEGLAGPFDLMEFAAAGRCEARLRDDVHGEFRDEWSREGGLSHQPVTAVFDVTWELHPLTLARAEWSAGYERNVRHWVVADDRGTAERFAVAASAYCNEPHDTVLLFHGGCWSKSRALWQEVQASSYDDLVLAGGLVREIREDFAAFVAAREEYARYGVPWKRGVLFVGPPGNGKTHCLRASVRFLGVPCLYVQSLKAKYETDDANIARVFDRAREVSPCCLVFEDLDAMLTADNRSVFLNQLDGFANASGLLTLATTNHPDRLDPSILERASRFDRKYTFVLPGPPERERYVEWPKWTRSPVTGCVQGWAASAARRPSSAPRSGGEANREPMTAWRSCAHRSGMRRPCSSLALIVSRDLRSHPRRRPPHEGTRHGLRARGAG